MNIDLSKQYLFRWFHGQPATPEQVEAFYAFLEWKPQGDEILRGNICLPSGPRISVPYSEEEAPSAANVYSDVAGPMEKWREKYHQEYAELDEEALWDKFNWHYLNFLISRRPDEAPCYMAQYTRKDGKEKQRPFRDNSTDPARPVERHEEKDYIPTSRAFLFEAGWEWHAVMLLLQKVSANGMDPDLAFELLLRIAEKADLKPDRQARLGTFIRDRLRQYPDVNQTKLGQAVGLSQDQVRRLAAKAPNSDTAAENARARREIEALILTLHREAAQLR